MDKDKFKKRLVNRNKKTSATISSFLLKKMKAASLIEYLTLLSFGCIFLGCVNLSIYCIHNRIPFPFSLPTISYSIIFVIIVIIAILLLTLTFFPNLFLGNSIRKYITQFSKIYSLGSQTKIISLIILPFTLTTITIITALEFEIDISIYSLIPIIMLTVATMFYVAKNSQKDTVKKRLWDLFKINGAICSWAIYIIAFGSFLTSRVTGTSYLITYSIAIVITIALIYINLFDVNKAITQKNKSVKPCRYPMQHFLFGAYTVVAVIFFTMTPNGFILKALGRGGGTIVRYKLNSPALPKKLFENRGPIYTTKPLILKSDLHSDFVYIKTIKDEKEGAVYSFPKSAIVSYDILTESILRSENNTKEKTPGNAKIKTTK